MKWSILSRKIQEGGSNGRLSEDSKNKIRKNKLGTKLTEVQKDRISKRVSGKGVKRCLT